MTPIPPRKIAVGIDGSASSTAALQWATGLALDEGGMVSAITAWNYRTLSLLPVIGTPVSPATEAAAKARERLDKVIEGVIEEVPGATGTVEPVLEMGSPRIVLTDASENHELLVLGRTTDSRLKQLVLGSTVGYCVRHSACPVVVVRDSIEPEQKITVAVDGSPSSIEALAWALGLGTKHEVSAIYSHNEFELELLSMNSHSADLESSAEQMLDVTIHAALERSRGGLRGVKRRIVRGDPRRTLVDEADPSALLVVGAQGHSGIARWALGSLADYAVQHAPGTVAIWR